MTAFTVYFIAADRQSSIEGETFETRAAADASIPAFKALLLEQCGEPEQEAEIEAGFFDVEEI